jgi:hypothetical protein
LLEVLLGALLFAAVVAFVIVPLRRAPEEHVAEDSHVADLQARKEAKYREIRDAELDHAQGKLSDADWARADAQLRREAIEILKQLDAAGSRPSEPRATG